MANGETKVDKKSAKRRAKEIEREEKGLLDEGKSGPFSTALVTLFIVLIWLVIIGFLIKLDVGGFASSVLTPVLKDVPVLQLLLPDSDIYITNDKEGYNGYTDLRTAVDKIKELEGLLETANIDKTTYSEDIVVLKGEVERLKTFEASQVEFQRIKTQFYEEVIYAENGPGAKEYVTYYESIDPIGAQNLYKQVVQQLVGDEKAIEYASAYSEMKPDEAAAILEKLENDLDLAAEILGIMSAKDRGAILGAMNPEIASKITKIMDPTP